MNAPGYIAWNDDLLRPHLHGLVANIPGREFDRKWVHAHRCTGCAHVFVCTVVSHARHEADSCPWCTPWCLTWREVKVKRPAKKRARRKATRRPSRVVA